MKITIKKDTRIFIIIIVASFLISSISGGIFGYYGASLINNGSFLIQRVSSDEKETGVVPEEQKVIEVVKNASPAVVSIVATKDLPIIEQSYEDPFGGFLNDPFFQQFFGNQSPFLIPKYEQKGTETQQVSAGTGFIVSSDGMILTNKHVIEVEGADFTVLLNDGRKLTAKILAKDPIKDIAILKIEGSNFPILKLADSDKLQIGQTVVAIGNALGEFRNTVSKGVISGLARSIVAGTDTSSEKLEQVIQTDAAINKGNSGGPLLNLRGEAIGINSAMVVDAQSIGFSIPINEAKKGIEDVKSFGRIIYPYLGIRYVLIDSDMAKEKSLPADYGALVTRGQSQDEPAVISESPADKVGIVENDIILEIDNQKINEDNDLAKIIQSKKVGDIILIKILSNKIYKTVEVTLEEKQ